MCNSVEVGIEEEASMGRSVGGQKGVVCPNASLCRDAGHQLVCDAAICVLEGLVQSCSPSV